MKLGRIKISVVLKICTAVVLVTIVLSEIDKASLVALTKRISMTWFALSIVTFFTSVWFMAYRYWILLGREPSFYSLLKVVTYQNILGNLVTTAAGAAWYVGVLHKSHDIGVPRSVLSLIIARIVDVIVLAICLILATLNVWDQIPNLRAFLLAIAFILIVLFAILFVLANTRIPRYLDNVRYFPGRPLLERYFVTAWHVTYHNTFSLIGYSFLIVLSMILFAYSSLTIFEVEVGIWQVIFVISCTQIINLVPVQIVGGLGVNDVTYYYLYELLGVGYPNLAAVIVGIRLVFYCTNLLLVASLLVFTVQPIGIMKAASYRNL